MEQWHRDHAMLALRINRLATGGASGTALIYRGPAEWAAAVEAEPPAVAGALAEEAERLMECAPTAYLAAHVRAVRAMARHLDGERLPLAEYGRECLGLEPRWVPEEVFEQAHADLDAALPRTSGTPADRLRAWQEAHTLRDIERLPGLVDRAVVETRARTGTIVPLPAGEVVECRLVEGVGFHAAGDYEGGLKSTIHINRAIPFNVADLLYLVAHEGHPGHIAESMLKERRLGEGQRVRFMLSPSFVLSEGLGLVAEELVFPGDEAQVWLNANVLPELGIRPDGSDFAAVHRARNVLWGVWGNAAFLAGEGRDEAEPAAYLRRWSLYGEEEVAAALGLLRPSPMSPYIFGYFHGWELVRGWATGPERVRRLLTEQLLPADLTS
ncbi:hypothetical protein HD597_006878 [Nonomuraea thailandensis]|uniref:DUF885 domain-containing protein n=1 Tax=Nonomuraea thailandensis TaxID=1188745 RepID=A0A9X2K4A8_9ACTN|nr:hypothetical protein [Nonomuraea thailandensis]MCP2359858.1 hypothetical protein [Nonomuraea thailandensis]